MTPMILEAAGVIMGFALIGFLWKIAFNLGKLQIQLAVICEKITDHDDRIQTLEHRDV